MYFYIGFGRFGFFMPWWLALTVGLPVFVVWLFVKGCILLTTASYRAGVRSAQLLRLHLESRRNAARSAEALAKLREGFANQKKQALAQVAPGAQRDEMNFWYDEATSAYLRFLFEGRKIEDWKAFASATNSIDELKRIHVGTCPRCGTGNQLVGRQCSYCNQARVAFTR